MSRFAHAALRASTFAVLAGLLVGCSGGKEKAVPKMAERLCWGVFASSDVSPILPPGDKVTWGIDPFVLNDDIDTVICTLYIDGNIKFQATANLKGFERSIDWSSMDPGNPKPIDVGKKGIIWTRGVNSYFVCEPSKDEHSPGKYIDLSITVFGSPHRDKLPTVLPPLMRQFVAFAQRELKCGAGATS
ncbi:hypothetical protein ABZV60_01505 [Streptomyces sp. NPDC004787]|uniref:hypothetical protein n=1 Tax=Streptomyces sp. NPDC004787 TaxID=3154291 RepID=UPI0033BC416D